jgi:aspartyl-tRNA(Asn)/glutamyl-tRNA(Gln) amidotransferase subunit C
MSSSKITRQEVERIAKLARLAPSEAEVEALAGDLSRILDYVAKLGEVDASSVEATPTTVAASALRPDELRPSLPREEALAAAPRAHDGGFSVPRVLEVES